MILDHNFLNSSNVSVTMKYTDLVKVMVECVKTTMKNNQTDNSSPTLVTAKTAAGMLNCSTSTINRWKKRGYLTAKTIGVRDYFSVKQIDELSKEAS